MYIFIIILVILVILLLKKNKENFTCSLNKKVNHIWMYWENKPNKIKPKYLDLCYQTIIKHNPNFHVHLLNEKNIYNFIPNLRKDLDMYLSIPQKTDIIRLELLYRYGGIWIDSDTIVFKSLGPLLAHLNKYDFIGFGCTGETCNTLHSGYPRPSNWVMIAKKDSILMRNCIKKAYQILDKNPYIVRRRYHILGRELIWREIEKLLKLDWTYLHMPSKCVERDTNGKKYRNNILLSNSNYDPKCDSFFLPIYNTSPGFPKWFLELSEPKLLKLDTLFTNLIKKSLNI